ncbi:UNVERIFIED_CONTAM: hypothetical protein RMT77_003232 [Armadillidium vulgare]
MTAVIQRQNVLQREIMVAESVKSYPVSYPALIKLSPTVGGLPPYSSCSASSLLQNAYPTSFSPPHRIEQRSPSQEHLVQDTGSGLSANGMSMDLTPAPSRGKKSEIFSQRKQREFIPDNKKDESYWDRRRRNNEAAKRSREKRRFNDMILEQRVIELSKENHLLKAQLNVIKEKYGIQGEGLINVDQVLSSMPQAEQILAISKRNKLSSALLSLTSTPAVTSLLSPNSMCPTSPGTSHQNQYSSQLSPASPTNSHYNYNSRDGRESPEFYQNNDSNPMDHDDEPEEMQGIQSHQNHLLQIPQYATHQYQDTRKQVPFYEQKALNLSSRSEDDHSSISPSSPPYPSIHSDFSSVHDVEMSRHSPLLAESGSCLPHKLRHKTHLGEKDAAQSLLALHGIKSEPRDHYHEDDSVSSDERDSAICVSTSSSPNEYPTRSSSSSASLEGSEETCRSSNEELEYENANLRSQLKHLATEVANIKCMLGRRPQTYSETDSDGSR